MNVAIIFSLLIAFIEELSEMNVTTNKLIIIPSISIMSFIFMYLTRNNYNNVNTNSVLRNLGISNPLSVPTPYVAEEEE